MLHSRLHKKSQGGSKNTISPPSEMISFINSFSQNEWLINGFVNEDPIFILKLYQKFALLINNGKYLELGCGTGILTRFLSLYSGKDIIPHGVDLNQQAIKAAKHNNSEYADNYVCEDFYQTLKSTSIYENKFSTICIFVTTETHHWNILTKLLTTAYKKNKDIYILIVAYGWDFYNIKNEEVRDFISSMKKLARVSFAGHNIMVIGKDPKKHLLAKKMKKSSLDNQYP